MDPLASKQKVAFTAEEKELLVDLLKREKVIEDKRTNKATNNLKAEAWDRITRRYNNHAFVTKREAIQLRRFWEKIKRRAKDGRSREIRSRMATGGGSPPPPDIDSVPGVDEVVPHLMYEIPGTVDSDTFFGTERQALCPPTSPDISMMKGGRERGMPSPIATQPGLQNRNSSARRRLAPTTASDVMSMRQINILKEREQQKEIYLLRRSILIKEEELASENLRHHQEINRIREIMKAEKLEHQRSLWKMKFKFASSSE